MSDPSITHHILGIFAPFGKVYNSQKDFLNSLLFKASGNIFQFYVLEAWTFTKPCGFFMVTFVFLWRTTLLVILPNDPLENHELIFTKWPLCTKNAKRTTFGRPFRIFIP
jgi:hypothetical protein